MRVSRWVIVAVVIAVAAVAVAKEAIRSRSARQAAEATTTVAPGPASHGAAGAAARPAPRGAAAAPASERKAAGPLPGSKLEAGLKNGRVTMADFGKGWCVPCKMMAPVLERAASDYSGKANIVFVDMEQYDDLARMYRISIMPTQIFFDATGHEVTRHVGYMGGDDIDSQMAKLGVRK